MPTNKQRREAARRHLERQLQRREQEAARRKQRNLIATVVGAVVIIAVIVLVVVLATGGSTKKKPTANASSPAPSASTSAPAEPKTSGPCGYTKGAAAASKDVGVPPDPSPTPSTTEAIDITSNLGAVTLTLDAAAAPCNVQSIAYLATKGYYDGSSCHRLVTNGIFVLQCGDPTGTGSGGPGYTTKDENLSAADYSGVGTIAMANSGADTNGSQFFIIYKDSSQGLQKNYTVIGKVTAGMDIVQKVATAGDDGSNGTGDGKPKLAITFTKVTATPAIQGSGTFVTPTPIASDSTAPGTSTASATDSASSG